MPTSLLLLLQHLRDRRPRDDLLMPLVALRVLGLPVQALDEGWREQVP